MTSARRTGGAANGRRSLTGGSAESERGKGFNAVGVMVSKVAAPVVAKRGGGILMRLKADWSTIVGAEWALTAWPVGLARDGVLKLRTAPATAIELQHRAPLLIERINLYFGRPAITRLVLIQGMPAHATGPSGGVPRFPAASEAQAFDGRLSGIADPELRAALGRLARALTSTDG